MHSSLDLFLSRYVCADEQCGWLSRNPHHPLKNSPPGDSSVSLSSQNGLYIMGYLINICCVGWSSIFNRIFKYLNLFWCILWNRIWFCTFSIIIQDCLLGLSKKLYLIKRNICYIYKMHIVWIVETYTFTQCHSFEIYICYEWQIDILAMTLKQYLPQCT